MMNKNALIFALVLAAGCGCGGGKLAMASDFGVSASLSSHLGSDHMSLGKGGHGGHHSNGSNSCQKDSNGKCK